MKFQITKESKVVLNIFMALFFIGLLTFISAKDVLKYSGFIITLFCILSVGIIIYFYRDPERQTVADSDIILAPADGMIVRIEQTTEEKHLKGPATLVAIFMHMGNVHVQRLPSDGTLLWEQHRPGKFRAILDPKAPLENEQRWYAFVNQDRNFTLVQIAGLLARRTISWLQPQQKYARGERLGMIALGSEIDLYLPPEVDITVQVGKKVKAGITPLGRWK